ncbi:MAG: antitoxin component YwqK of YwqJK toxin-antitoxin module [Planctomycetota bacterium]|jgi:antitoxin component YwqK of YwqJK toxin-antitoxin module
MEKKKRNIIIIVILVIVLLFQKQTIKEYSYQDGTLVEKYQVSLIFRFRWGYDKMYYKGGKVVQDEVHYSFNFLNGKAFEYFENGNIKFEATYKFNKLWNVHMYLNYQGADLDYGNFNNGNGHLKMYYKSGELMKEGEVRDGQYYEKWKYYTNVGFFYREYENNVMLF